MNLTVKLLRIIGSPFVPTVEVSLNDSEVLPLYDCAANNRVSLLYLETLKKLGKLGKLEADYDKRFERYQRFINAVVKTSEFLDSLHIEHAIVKTIRPFIAAPSDIDVLCFGSDGDYEKAVKAMFEAGYKRVPSGPPIRQIKLYHPEDGIWIDLHKEIGASRIIYINKRKFSRYITEAKLPNGGIVKVLIPEADLAVMMVHSVITEFLYTLVEYYATLYWLLETDAEGTRNFITIVRENNMLFAAKTCLSITAELHKVAHGVLPEKLVELSASLGIKTSETKRLAENGFKTPHRYHLLTVAKALLEKMKEKEARRCIIPQVNLIISDADSRRAFIKDLKDNLTREAPTEKFWETDSASEHGNSET